MPPALSVVIPAYNEQDAIGPLYARLKPVLDRLGRPYEIIFVDDGSRDRSWARLEELQAKDSGVRLIKLRGNFGQSAAIDAGFKHVRGQTVVTLDADLQNDPQDIPRLLQVLDSGYDMVTGWRHPRHDGPLKVLFSGIARHLRQIFVEDNIHDSGCSLKAYRREAADALNLYGEMHRYIPALLQLQGFRITETKVHHHPRKIGQTKYTASRVFRGFMDLVVVTFWQKYSLRPSHFFGAIGMAMGVGGFAMWLILLYRKFSANMVLTASNLPLLASLLIIVGIQFFLFGLLADMIMRTYYKDTVTYRIEKVQDARPAP